jgi:hypothetical protein
MIPGRNCDGIVLEFFMKMRKNSGRIYHFGLSEFLEKRENF